uniref:DNA topoisomerase 2 n=1 Tax=Biomphalaria glabrata TaxID=6526 RepID=A0A2C9K9W2_BIOGL
MEYTSSSIKILEGLEAVRKRPVNDINVELALQHVDTEDYVVASFCNNISTHEGGTHEEGFKMAFTRVINNYLTTNFKKSKDKINLQGEDIREGLTCLISIKHPEPQYEGQTKGKLSNSDARKAVNDLFDVNFEKFLLENPEVANKIIEKGLEAQRARIAAKKAREFVKRKGVLEISTLPGKLADCSSRNPKECELFLVEGDSAGGSAKLGRNREIQAILPLKGKVINVEKNLIQKIMNNQEIGNLIKSIGCGIQESFDIAGIAVGMATNIPPHNLNNVIDALILQINDDSVDIEKLIDAIQGPDFPTGGYVSSPSNIRKIYRDGSGSVTIQAKVDVLEEERILIVKEIPYQTNKARIIERIAELVNDKIIEGISDIKDESNYEGIRIVIKYKKGFESEVEILVKKTRFELKAAEQRIHLLLGIKKAVEDIDKTVRILKESRTSSDAISNLCDQLEITQVQAKAILDMKMQRLVEKFGDERRSEITEDYSNIEDEDLIKREDIVVLMTQSNYIKRIPVEEYKLQNRGGVGTKSLSFYEDDVTKLVTSGSTHDDYMFFTKKGFVYRIKGYKIFSKSKQSKGIPIINLLKTLEKDDDIKEIINVSKEDYNANTSLSFITKTGLIKKTSILHYARINVNGKIAISLRENDEIVNVLKTTKETKCIVVTSNGKGLRFDASLIRDIGRSSQGVKAIKLLDNSYVVSAANDSNSKYLLIITEKGMGKLNLLDEGFRIKGRGTQGYNLISKSNNDRIVYSLSVNENDEILLVTEKVYITTPIYYPNSTLHIGHAYSTVIADSYKRFRINTGDDVYFLTGSDEHVTVNNEKMSKSLGNVVNPLELIDKYGADSLRYFLMKS